MYVNTHKYKVYVNRLNKLASLYTGDREATRTTQHEATRISTEMTGKKKNPNQFMPLQHKSSEDSV